MAAVPVPVGRGPSRPTPFDEGYLAAARASKRGRSTVLTPACPHPLGTLARAVWLEGASEWLRDLEHGKTPPSWRIL